MLMFGEEHEREIVVRTILEPQNIKIHDIQASYKRYSHIITIYEQKHRHIKCGISYIK